MLFFGGRDFRDEGAMRAIFDRLPPALTEAGFCVIHGAAKGADTIAGNVAKARGVPVIEVPANWDFYKLAAGPVRNTWMLDFCRPNYAVGLPGGRGTANMLAQCLSRSIPVWLPFSS